MGQESGGSKREVIYTDNIVEVTEVVRLSPSFEGKIKVGDLLPVRTLGGTVTGVTFKNGIDDLLPMGKNILLFLVDGNKEPTLPSSKTSYYSLVGTINGVFNLTSDGLAVRDKVKDSFNLQDVLDTIKETKLKNF